MNTKLNVARKGRRTFAMKPKRNIVLSSLLLGSLTLLAAEMPKPLFELKMNEEEGDNVVNSGTGKLNARIVDSRLSHRGEGREGGKALYLDNDLADRKSRTGSCVIMSGAGRSPFTTAEPFAVTMWIKPDPKLSRNGAYALFSTFTGDYGRGIQLLYGWGRLRAETGDGAKTGFQDLSVKTMLKLGSWNHVGVVYDGKKLTLYLNGIAGAEKEVKMSPPSASSFTIGAFLGGFARRYTGAIAEFRLYDTALTPKQMQEEAGVAEEE